MDIHTWDSSVVPTGKFSMTSVAKLQDGIKNLGVFCSYVESDDEQERSVENLQHIL